MGTDHIVTNFTAGPTLAHLVRFNWWDLCSSSAAQPLRAPLSSPPAPQNTAVNRR